MKVVKIKTALGLGVINLARVVLYQLGVRTGFNPVKKLQFKTPQGVFFSAPRNIKNIRHANNSWDGSHEFFGRKIINDGIPNWHKNFFTGSEAAKDLPWFAIGDFNSDVGDIKGVWEASRFNWVISFAQSAAAGNESCLLKLNNWLNDWCENNPPYKGVNWKCGQEASIRVMHLACAAIILEQSVNTSEVLINLIEAHLQRIAPTTLYAVAQDNNHGTSEAAALFIGGDWLAQNGIKRGEKWRKQGRDLLENRASRLILSDGTFSQYSTNYHRVMLDAYSIAEAWRKRNNLEEFSDRLKAKICSAINWIYDLVSDSTGDVPNLGANDGARLLPLVDSGYRDFRPSVQLAAALFNMRAAWSEKGIYDIPLEWLGVEKPNVPMIKRSSVHHPDGGFFVLRSSDRRSLVLFSYPKYKFRPSQNDALHVDLWVDNENILRDGGTYSYNAGQSFIDYYGGVRSHNTIEIDCLAPMPRISRFLVGEWLTPENVVSNLSESEVAAGYTDYLGRSHHRQLRITENKLVIIDRIKGVKNSAVLRWRLKPGHWELDNCTVKSGEHSLTVSSNATILRCEVTEGRESRYYYEETALPVLEVEVTQDCTLTTEYILK